MEGCGKNLLLHLLGLLELPDDGDIVLRGENTGAWTATQRDTIRQQHYGFLFPSAALLPSLSVLENIAFSVLKAGVYDEKQQAALTLAALQFCALENEAECLVAELSSERQAVTAFARAIAHRPLLLIAESPPEEKTLVPLAQRALEELGITVIWSTEMGNPATLVANHILTMNEGKLMA